MNIQFKNIFRLRLGTKINFAKLVVMLACISAFVLSLTACSSHENPLSRIDPNDSAIFLVDASYLASDKLHINDGQHAYFVISGPGKGPIKGPLARHSALIGLPFSRLRGLGTGPANRRRGPNGASAALALGDATR